MDYFYDEQIRRYIQQFIRLFGGFSVRMGRDSNGNQVYQRVPVRYGDMNRMAAAIIRQNSENTINTTPFMSSYITGMTIKPDYRANPTHVEKVRVYERKYNQTSLEYENDVGDTYTIERHMPVPYDITMQLDIWTSNTEQKLQLLEQILVLFNPSLNIHTSDNEFDWSALTYVELTNVQWSIRQIPQGVDDIIDVASLEFNFPVLINPPAKVRRQTLIHTIINKLQELETDSGEMELFEQGIPVSAPTQYTLVALEDYQVQFLNGEATILTKSGGQTDSNGNLLDWKTILEPFGQLKGGISNIRFKRPSGAGDPLGYATDVIGTLQFHPTQSNKLLVQLDTSSLPNDTLAVVNGIIDPTKSGPGTGGIPAAAAGQRYLILDNLPSGPNSAWGSGNTAQVNDIVEYNGSQWVTVFDADQTNSTQFVTNVNTSKQYEWDYQNKQWIDSYEGVYSVGFWRIYL